MPGGNRGGPMGQGPMTGRGLGFCGGFGSPGLTRGGGGGGFGRGRGFGGGFGGGHGWRHGFHATGLPGWMRWFGAGQADPSLPPGDAERQFLARQADMLREQLRGIEERLKRAGEPETKG